MKDKTKQAKIQVHISKKKQHPIIVERFPVSYCYNIAHAQTTPGSSLCSARVDFRKRNVSVETYKNSVTLFLSWINFHICTCTVLYLLRPGSTIKCRHYALCMNDICVRFAREVKQHYL